MKRTILNVKANKKDEFWCSLNGNALELMGANLAALTNTIESMKEAEERGDKLLKMLLEDIVELFEVNGITLKNTLDKT